MNITRGQALERLTTELNIDGKRAQDLIATLPSPYTGDESFPLEVIDDLLQRNRPPQTAEEFAALGRSETSSPPAMEIKIRQVAIAAGPNGSYVVALAEDSSIWLWVEGGIAFHELPRIQPIGFVEMKDGSTGNDAALGATSAEKDTHGGGGKHGKHGGKRS